MPLHAEQLRKATAHYGKVGANLQFRLLNESIKKAITGIKISAKERNALLELDRELRLIAAEVNEQEKLRLAIAAVKLFIVSQENENRNAALLNSFVKHGLYRMLYRNSSIKGEEGSEVLGRLLKNGFWGVGLSALILIMFATVSFVAAPVWITVIATTLFASSMTFLSAILYGVVNDLFATRANLPYFLLGHQPAQKSLLRTNDPIAQGVAWGVAATFGPAVLASIVFGIATAITASLVPFATFIFPVMLVAMPLIALGADIYAKRKAKEYMSAGVEIPSAFLNTYQTRGLASMCSTKEEKAAWFANSDRNFFGFTKMPLIGLSALAAMITLSSVHTLLPAVLFSATLAATMPIAFAGVAIVALTIAGIYMYVNRNKQIDNRFKLAFDKAPNAVAELYLDEDLALVEELNNGASSEIARSEEPLAPQHFLSPLSGALAAAASAPPYLVETAMQAKV